MTSEAPSGLSPAGPSPTGPSAPGASLSTASLLGLVESMGVESDTADQRSDARSLLESLQVAIYTTDADGRITFFNQAAADLWGRRPELGEEWCGSLRLYWPDERPMRHDECPMAETLRTGRAIRGTAIAERPDGGRVAFMAYPSPLRDAHDRLVGAVNVLVDITAHLAAEQTIRAGVEALRQSNAVKDEFLGLVSHELRTPVTTIYGNAQLLRSRADALTSAQRKEMITDIAEDSERLLAVIENLLLLTRIEGGAALELEPQVIAHVIGTVVNTFRDRRRRHVTFTSMPAYRLVVDADRTSLELVIGNLLSNADKYSPPSEPIEVVLRVTDGEAQVSVLDRGIGLPTETDADELFTPFFRAQAAREKASGMGIGLAVCKRLAEAQGGRVWAAQRPGGGAEVGFALPLTPEPEA